MYTQCNASKFCCLPLFHGHNNSHREPTEIYPFDWTHNSMAWTHLYLQKTKSNQQEKKKKEEKEKWNRIS